jgi:hypothetical protein
MSQCIGAGIKHHTRKTTAADVHRVFSFSAVCSRVVWLALRPCYSTGKRPQNPLDRNISIFWDIKPCSPSTVNQRRSIIKDRTFYNHRCENLKSFGQKIGLHVGQGISEHCRVSSDGPYPVTSVTPLAQSSSNEYKWAIYLTLFHTPVLHIKRTIWWAWHMQRSL